MDDELPHARFTGIFLPVEILELEEITFFEAGVLSWIDALYSKKHGGCYASNEYLAKMLRVKENTIAKIITKLRHLGLVKDISFDGRQRVIRACFSKTIEESQSKAALDLNPTLGWTKIQPSVGRKSKASDPPSLLYESKEERKEESASPPLSASASSFPSPRKKVKESYKKIFPNVNLTATQQTSILEKCDGNEELVNKVYQKLHEWKISKGISGGANDYSALCKWTINAVKDSPKALMNKTIESVSDAEIYARQQKIRSLEFKNKSHPQGHYISDKINYARIQNDDLYYSNPKFYELLDHWIRKYELKQ